MKLTINEIEEILYQKQIPADKVKEVVKALTEIVDEKKDEKEESKTPKQKNEMAIIIVDDDGSLKDKSLVGFVVQQPQGNDAGAILSKLTDAAREQNAVARKKANKLESLYDIFAGLKRKFIKEKMVLIKTKEPVRVIVSMNKF